MASDQTLYIVGNGFDRFHSLDTSYEHYRDWLNLRHPRVVSELKQTDIFHINRMGLGFDDYQSWSDLEKSLSLDLEWKLQKLIEAYGLPDSCEYWHEMRDEVETEVEFLRNFTGAYFYEWLVYAESKESRRMLALDEKASFITFNYTRTLERVYSIPSASILHIHGVLDDNIAPVADAPIVIGDTSTAESIECCTVINPEVVNSDIVRSCIQFGTPSNNPLTTKENLVELVKGKSVLEGFEDVLDLLVEASDNTYKNIEANKQDMSVFLASKNIDHVVILGHNISGIDWPYYEEILIPTLKNADWKIASRKLKKKNDSVEKLHQRGIEPLIIPWLDFLT